MTSLIKSETPLVPAEMAAKIIKLTELKKEVIEQLDELKERLLEFTQQNDVFTLKTGSYTISRGKRETITIYDHLAASQTLKESDIEPKFVEVLDPQCQELVKGIVKAGKTVNGTSHQITEYITVKIPKEKK